MDTTVAPAGQPTETAKPIELAVFGDSAVAGEGVSEMVDTLPVQLAQRVADELGRRVHVTGYGRSGARTADVLAAQLPRTRPSVDLSVLVVGTNDITHLVSPRRLVTDSAALLDALAALGGPVVMSGLPEFRAMHAIPRPLRDTVVAYGGVVRTVQQRAARRAGVRLVDVRRAVGAEFVRDPTLVSSDGFHPSQQGYGRIADALAPSAIALLSTATAPCATTAAGGTDLAQVLENRP